ncbi:MULTISPECIES: hypothetical protein [unclassified Bradyrhizobium]|uniref:hypothetical protein n=1 Tax=unclassified Bradyrhizobium TaxID=2631580 RepID=UPI002448C604|nr:MULTISPECIES: hypothetical protein [unclassified Bradyrhizobium]MDH2341257.1 hypothetical protein [Bradyrhizobium sp. SSUT77]MDH2351866.1 hypothetical protein [Bradyrhizobium sp. SSUT112]
MRSLPAPKELRPAPTVASDALETWKLEPGKPDWAGGKTYPQPIVDHAKGRERALVAYAKIRKG